MLQGACSSYTYVRRGYFSPKRDYYLRFYVPNSHDNPFYSYDDPKRFDCGTFDVTCALPLAERIVAAVRATGISNVFIIAATEFFAHPIYD